MKFGRKLETESVPEWSLHNIDYNTLKEYIKVHTTRDQASAITIPGQKDTALQRFEADFYDELCRQHDRVGLFVATKADEINRRLRRFFFFFFFLFWPLLSLRNCPISLAPARSTIMFAAFACC